MTQFNFTAKDKINALNDSIPLKNIAGKEITVTAAAIDEQPNIETGDTKTVAYLKADNGDIYGTTSPTATQSIGAIIDYMTAENVQSVTLRVNSRKSTAGRDFLTISIM